MSSTMLGRWIFADTSDCEVLLRTVSRQIKKENNKKEEERNGERDPKWEGIYMCFHCSILCMAKNKIKNDWPFKLLLAGKLVYESKAAS